MSRSVNRNRKPKVPAFRARTDLLLHRAGDSWIVVDPRNDTVHELNAVAMRIWHHCDGAATTARLAPALAATAGIALEQATMHVSAALRELRKRKLIEEE